jgi:hypothetical protein
MLIHLVGDLLLFDLEGRDVTSIGIGSVQD